MLPKLTKPVFPVSDLGVKPVNEMLTERADQALWASHLRIITSEGLGKSYNKTQMKFSTFTNFELDENVLSGHPEQEDFLAMQVTVKIV